jgi:hypothetical protein
MHCILRDAVRDDLSLSERRQFRRPRKQCGLGGWPGPHLFFPDLSPSLREFFRACEGVPYPKPICEIASSLQPIIPAFHIFPTGTSPLLYSP